MRAQESDRIFLLQQSDKLKFETVLGSRSYEPGERCERCLRQIQRTERLAPAGAVQASNRREAAALSES